VTLCQDDEPPLTSGLVGSVRSSRTVLAAVGLAGSHADALPALSTARNCTSVSPSAVTSTLVPVAGTDQLAPPSVEVRYSSCEKPDPPASACMPAVIVVEVWFFHASEPPLTPERVGRVWSSMTVEVAAGVAGAQFDGFPAPSITRNCTIVVPSAEMDATAPAAGADQVRPWSVDVRYWRPATPEPPASPVAAPVTSTDGGATWSSPAPGSSLVVSSEGETLVQFQSLDNAGNASAWVQATVRLDRSAPTAPTVTGGSLSWSNTPVTVTAAGSTDAGGSGFSYQYRTSTDGHTWSQPGAGSSYQTTGDGTTYVQFQAVDNAGNASGWAPAVNGPLNTAMVDTAAPTAPAVSGGSSSWQTALSVTVSASSSDSLSGLAGYQYRTSTDGGATWSSPAAGGSVPVTAPGTTYVQFRATDNAGNQTAWTPAAPTAGSTVKLDRAAPTAPTISGGSLNWSTTPITLTASGASDPLSGVKTVNVRTSTDGGVTWSAPTPLTGTTYQVSTQGTTLVQAQAIDNAGNAGAWSPVSPGAANTVKVDSVAPTLPSATGGQGTGTCRKHLTVTQTGSTDATSGIARYDYRVSTNGGSTWGTPVTNQSSVSFSSTGTYYVQFRAIDAAGNISGWGPASPTTGSTACIR